MYEHESESLTLDEWAEQCWSLLALRPRTLYGYRSAYRLHISPTFGHRHVGSITRREIQRWVLAQSAPQQKANLPILKTLYREAVFHDVVDVNPTAGVRRMKHISPRRDFRVWEEIDAIDFGRYNNLFRFLAMHGLRWSECMALTPDDIHDGYVWVTKSAKGLPTKSGRERRVPYMGYFETFPRSYKWARERLQKEAGVTIHSLRKTYAYSLKVSGVHPQIAQQLLGHSTIKLTMDLYTDVLPQEIDEVRSLLGGLTTSNNLDEGRQ